MEFDEHEIADALKELVQDADNSTFVDATTHYPESSDAAGFEIETGDGARYLVTVVQIGAGR